jgi:hypothetical protein
LLLFLLAAFAFPMIAASDIHWIDFEAEIDALAARISEGGEARWILHGLHMQVQKSSQSSGHGNAILAVARMIQFVAPPYVVFHSDPIGSNAIIYCAPDTGWWARFWVCEPFAPATQRILVAGTRTSGLLVYCILYTIYCMQDIELQYSTYM